MKDFFNFFGNDAFLIGWALNTFGNRKVSYLKNKEYFDLYSPFGDDSCSNSFSGTAGIFENYEFTAFYGTITDVSPSLVNPENVSLYCTSLSGLEKIVVDSVFKSNDVSNVVFVLSKKEKLISQCTSAVFFGVDFTVFENACDSIIGEDGMFDIVKLDELIQKNT